MGGAVILNWVLGAIIFVLIVGGGVYAIFRHGKAGPNDQEARQHYGAKADPNVTPLGEHVPAEPVAAAHGLTESQSPGKMPRRTRASTAASLGPGRPATRRPGRAATQNDPAWAWAQETEVTRVRRRSCPGAAGS